MWSRLQLAPCPLWLPSHPKPRQEALASFFHTLATYVKRRLSSRPAKTIPRHSVLKVYIVFRSMYEQCPKKGWTGSALPLKKGKKEGDLYYLSSSSIASSPSNSLFSLSSFLWRLRGKLQIEFISVFFSELGLAPIGRRLSSSPRPVDGRTFCSY